MLNIEGRLRQLQKLVESARGEKVTVILRDGRTKYLTGDECIDLLKTDPLTVARFGAEGPGHGHLPDLLNDLREGSSYG